MIVVDGAQIQGVYRNGQACPVIYNGVQVWPDSPGPAELPSKTLRFDFHYDHFNPVTDLPDRSDIGATWTYVADDVYDFHFDSPSWYCTSQMSPARTEGGLFNIYRARVNNQWVLGLTHAFDIIDSNLSGVTDIKYLLNTAYRAKDCVFKNTGDVITANYAFGRVRGACDITSINALDLHSATDVSYLFYNSRYLASPLNITFGSVTNCSSAFSGCYLVPSGQLDTYDKLINQSTPPTNYSACFSSCGRDSVTGAAELAQIPTTWGGTMAV